MVHFLEKKRIVLLIHCKMHLEYVIIKTARDLQDHQAQSFTKNHHVNLNHSAKCHIRSFPELFQGW